MGFLDEFKRLAHPYEDEDDEEFEDDYEPSPRPVERRERERSVRSEQIGRASCRERVFEPV